MPLVLTLYHKARERQGNYVSDKKERKKMGRPTDNPKSKPIHVRLDEECIYILNKYQEKYKKNRAESIRDGIKKLKKEI